MPDAEELERSAESTAEEGRPLAITHENQVQTFYLSCVTLFPLSVSFSVNAK